MKRSSKPGTAYISMGAGLVPALSVSTIATVWTTLWVSLINGDILGLLVGMNGMGVLIEPIVIFSPYGAIAFLLHAISIAAFPKLNWKWRAALYALIGSLIAISFLFVQFTLFGLSFEQAGLQNFHFLVIPGALTALSVYAFHGVLLYGAKRILKME